jgi:predicted phosphoribosyltransferase
MYEEILKDRKEAGMLLSQKLEKYQHTDTIILAIPRGGVPIG